jgi:uncharacterized protein (TIGR00730 family)
MPHAFRSLCVYCGSSAGASPSYAHAARDLAHVLTNANINLVYGGGNVGLMGIVANEMLQLGAQVTGVIPQALMKREVGHLNLTQLHVVKDMHERKAMMADLSDGFIAMPGGMGTLEELFEVLTWSQLGLHDKPIALLNVDGFYNGLLDFMQHLVEQRFVKPEHAALLVHANTPATLLECMQAYEPKASSKWLDKSTAQRLLP